MKSYKILFVAVLTAFLISACGNDSEVSNASGNLSDADMEVEAFNELPSCVEKREGKIAYVVDLDQGYVCRNGEWIEKEVAVINKNIKYGSLKDSRDGRTYKTVVIGSQTWMAENLNYKTDNSYCYKDSAKSCDEYGRLYAWAAAINACPDGWRLPMMIEWETLIGTVGNPATAGKMLKSTNGWNGFGNGTDDYAFSALPAGKWNSFVNSYGSRYHEANFWSSTEYEDAWAFFVRLDSEFDYADLGYYTSREHGFSVRCVKD